ncbi:MAG: GTP-binding protein [Burkholderiaceae bacterium]
MTPVTVLTGFLGSGKTTLLAHWLKTPALSNSAVIINEFGDIGLDHFLVQASKDSVVRLTTGCLCCVVRDDLIDTLNHLDAKRAAGEVGSFERVIIETSGMADPGAICHALLNRQALRGDYYLEHIVTTLDCTQPHGDLNTYPQAARQLALADRIIVTKTDLLADNDETIDLGALLSSNLNPFVTDPSVHVFNAASVWRDPKPVFAGPDYNNGALSGRNKGALGVFSSAYAGASRRVNRHHREFDSLVLQRSQAISAVGLTLFLQALAEHCGDRLLRIKGIVSLQEDSHRPAVIHGIGHILYPLQWLDQWPDENHDTRLVLIGRRLSKPWLQLLLDTIELEVQGLGT